MSAYAKDIFAMITAILLNVAIGYFFGSHMGYAMAVITAFFLIGKIITGGEHHHG